MPSPKTRWIRGLLFVASGGGLGACGGGDEARLTPEAPAPAAPPGVAPPATPTEEERARSEHEAMLDREFPKHGLVTGLQLTVRDAPSSDARAIGWLRVGSRVRLKADATAAPGCASGWYAVHPHGFACAGQGITVGDTPPEGEFVLPPPARERPLPYSYWFVKEDSVPEYHRPPSRDDQRAALAFGTRLSELRASEDHRRAERLLAGQLGGEPTSPSVVNRYLDRGFFVAAAGVEVRAFRRFVRTVRGRFIKQAQLEERQGSDFAGLELGAGEGARTLPVAWVVRAATPMVRRDRADGSVRFVDAEGAAALARHSVVDGWQKRENVGGDVMHVFRPAGATEDQFVRAWFFSVAERIERPREVRRDSTWAHVDLSEQTLVVYRGSEPIYATLVSTGLEGFATPTGLFEIHSKYVADSMADLGDDRDARYSIDDVPWTQYFSGSLALHGAFWHERFGLPRSHGCVNLAPTDAHRVFDLLGPTVPEGWVGVASEWNRFRGSQVLVTE